MKWLLTFFLVSQALASTPNDYKDPQTVFQEKSFTVFSTTPNYQDMTDGEIAIYQSSANAKDVALFLRAGTTVYASPMFPIIKAR